MDQDYFAKIIEKCKKAIKQIMQNKKITKNEGIKTIIPEIIKAQLRITQKLSRWLQNILLLISTADG